jgi:ent-copalyl diphosphate synthase
MHNQNGENMDKTDELDRMVGFEMQELVCFPQRQLRGQRDQADVSSCDQELLLCRTLLTPETIEHHISKVIFEDVV